MTIENVQWQSVTHGAGIMSAEIEIDHSSFTDSTTTGKFDWTNPIPPYSLRLGCLVETTEVFNEAVTVAVGITDAANEWTSATTGTCTALGYKAAFPYGAATIITGAFSGSTEESVHITLTHGSDYTLITTGKIKLRVFFLATQTV